MKALNFILIFFVFISFGCSSTSTKSTSTLNLKNTTVLKRLNQQKKVIDSLANDTNSLVVYAKVPSNLNPVLVKNANFPDEVEVSYNVLKDKKGKVIYIFESPTGESGDWDIAYRSYFDKNGKLFAFERKAGFFNSECTDGVAHEVSVKYYSQNANLIDSTYSLIDDNKKSLMKSKCNFNYNFSYTIYKSSENYIKANHLKLPPKHLLSKNKPSLPTF